MSQVDDNQVAEEENIVDAMIERALKRSETIDTHQDTTPRFTVHEDGKVSSRYIDQNGLILFTTTDVNGPPHPTRGRTITMNIHTFVSFFETMRPRRRAYMFAGNIAAQNIVTAGVELAGHTLTFDDQVQIMRALHQLEVFMQAWPTLEHLVLEYTYIMLRNKHLKHGQAADDATVLLGEYVSRDAWRMRVRKFAKDAGLPPVEQRKRAAD